MVTGNNLESRSIGARMVYNNQLDSGFTLLELMIIVAILGIMASLAYAGLYTLKAGYDVSAAANSLYSDLQWAKQESIGSENSYGIRLDNSTDSYEIYQQNGSCDSSASTTKLNEKNNFGVVNIGPDRNICFTKRGTTNDWSTITINCRKNACSKQKQIIISRFKVELQ